MNRLPRALFLTLLLVVAHASSAQAPPPAAPNARATPPSSAASAAGVQSPPAAAAALPSRLFTFETDEFWLNLHHFLYVLGRAEAKLADANEPSVARAPKEAERGMQSLTPGERTQWSAAVRAYAAGPSQKAALDESLVTIVHALGDLDDAPTVAGAGLDAALVETLERAAPIYRKAWWPAHRAANRAWRSAVQTLIDQDGATVIGFVTRAYGFAWPAAGQPVHVSSYANFGGAYSSWRTGTLVVSSQSELNAGLRALEAIVHESMHQWDGQVFRALLASAPQGATVPRDLTHAMIFYTAGEAVHRLDATYVPTAEAYEIWPKRLSGSAFPAQRLRPALEDVWKPWLDGRGTRDAALAALLERAIAVSR